MVRHHALAFAQGQVQGDPGAMHVVVLTRCDALPDRLAEGDSLTGRHAYNRGLEELRKLVDCPVCRESIGDPSADTIRIHHYRDGVRFGGSA